ncbi:hypothetical protein LFT44_21785 (plasmid) [Arthrobacter sp. FW306-05-C]|uniref:hypothetical protein n=1 Tax=Arthrobacter sp. FW306-05-C TaxID=2879620 RepID=UPI001F31DB34|nr:hypothetical protein [Arthrobacter sp. FW306-05-C]UKA69152.1 hypothetical protein LFT44_21785 [Arthrobacter sp. FW306-05-C]
MVQKDPEMGHPVIPPGTPEWLIPVLGVVFAAVALILLIIAGTIAGGAGATVFFLVSGLVSLVLAVNMARVWRRSRREPRDHTGQ